VCPEPSKILKRRGGGGIKVKGGRIEYMNDLREWKRKKRKEGRIETVGGS
jgi:hypothetical protein